MRPGPWRAFLVVALCCAASIAVAQPRRSVPDESIVREASLVASGVRIDLFQHEGYADPALVGTAERALSRMEALLGRKLDEATLGARVRIYVSGRTKISHVWRGYEHPRDPKAALFLNPRVAEAALRGTNATYAHELAHLLSWRYRSHTLREGLADYLALELHPGAAVGPAFRGYAFPPPAYPEIDEYLGTSKPPPAVVRSDASFRVAYYFASYRFVRFLIERSGMTVFLKVYEAEDPEGELRRQYGATREELVAAAK